MDAGILQHDKDADDQDEIADDLRDRVLKRPVEPAVNQEAVKEKAFCSRGNPEDGDEKRDEEKQLDETEAHARDRRSPEERDAGGVDRVDGEEDKRRDAEDRGDDRREIRVQLEAGKESSDEIALEARGDEQTAGEQRGESDQPQKRHIVAADIEQRSLEEGEVHFSSLGGCETRATAKRRPIDGSSKSKTPSSKEALTTKSQSSRGEVAFLELGIWNFFGTWRLGFGTSGARFGSENTKGADGRRAFQTLQRKRAGLLLGLLVFDVLDHVADGLQFLRVFVGNFYGEFLFERHYQFDDIERIRAQILDE